MLPYNSIASALEEIGQAPRRQKADIVSGLLAGIPHEIFSPVVKLLTGDLWPAWEPRELGIGPEAITSALEEISRDDMAALRNHLGEMGAVAMSALQHKIQHPLSVSPLDALAVYDSLRRISRLNGPESDHRKIAILRGLLLDATPLEGKYIARTVMGNMLAGLGPQTMVAAISQSFGLSMEEVRSAYNLMPDISMLASAAAGGDGLSGTMIQPSRPVKPMLMRTGVAALPAAHLPVYPGLRVQVHVAGGKIYVYTSRLKNITAALFGLVRGLQDYEHEMILDAHLMGFQDGRAVCQAEVVRHINRRHFARRSRVSPALAAHDILYLEGVDLTCLAYEERRKRLIEILGEPKDLPFQGVSSARELILKDPEEVKSYFAQALKSGCKGLMARDLRAPYTPGSYSSCDFLLKEEETVTAAIIGAKFGRGRREGILARYQVALRSGDDLVPVGWASAGLRRDEAESLSDQLRDLILVESGESVEVRPQVALALRIAGAIRDERGYSILRPRIEEVWFDAAFEEVDGIERLEGLYRR
jgi:DNA ligase-1